MAVVYLNVGGVCFVTRRDTLLAGDTFFSGLAAHHPDCEEIFVDRDPTHFRHVLNWLRGVRVLPQDSGTVRELVAEADYYCMHDMKTALLTHGGESLVGAIEAVAAELRRGS